MDVSGKRTIGAVLVAFALVAGGLTLAPSTPTAAAKKPAFEWGGANHFVLAASKDLIPQREPVVLVPKTDEEAAAMLPKGAVLSKTPDGKYLAILPDGSLKPLTGEVTTTAAATASTSKLIGGADGVEAAQVLARNLKGAKGIDKVQALSGGLVSVETKLSIDDVRKQPGVATAYADTQMKVASYADGNPPVHQFNEQWDLHNTGQTGEYEASADAGTPGADIHVLGAWTKSTGRNTVVAVLDTGDWVSESGDWLDPSLPIFWKNNQEICGNKIDDDHNGYVDDCNGWDFVQNDGDVRPGNVDYATNTYTDDAGMTDPWHGETVRRIIRGDGGSEFAPVAPDAVVMPIRAIPNTGLTDWAEPTIGPASNYAAGIVYAVDNGANVINISGSTDDGFNTIYSRADVALFEEAVKYARDHNVVIVAAAGNQGISTDMYRTWPSAFSAYYDNVISVAATDKNDAMPYFSNYGVKTVDVLAPGHRTPAGGSGTSIAAAYVSGTAALMLADKPTLTPAQIKQTLRATADTNPSLIGRSASGRINAAKALGVVEHSPFYVDYTPIDNPQANTDFTVSGTVHLNDNGLRNQSGTQLRAWLMTTESSRTWAVTDMPVTLTVNGDTKALTTDSAGSVLLADPPNIPTSGLPVTYSSNLPGGEYIVRIGLVDSSGKAITKGGSFPLSVNDNRVHDINSDYRSDPAADSMHGVLKPDDVYEAYYSDPTQDTPVAGFTPSTPPSTAAMPHSSTTTTTVVGSAPTGSGSSENTDPGSPGPASTGSSPGDDGGATVTTQTTNDVPNVSVTSTTVANAAVTTTTTAPARNATAPPDDAIVPVLDAPVSSRIFRVDSITPTVGSFSGGTIVTITGQLTGVKFVRFGTHAGTITSNDGSTLIVSAPPSWSREVVDVVVGSFTESLTLHDMFQYLSPDEIPGPSTPEVPVAITATTSAPNTPTTAPRPTGTTVVMNDAGQTVVRRTMTLGGLHLVELVGGDAALG